VVLQAAPATDAGVRQIGTLRVAGQASEGASPWGLADADAVYRDSGSRVHLDHQQLERFRGQSIGDVLAGAVGVHTADVRNGGALDVNIRGLQGQNRVPVIIDGGQQAIDVYRGYAGVQQRSYLDPDLISAVSIEKGPSLAANAASAIGGVVYMETLNVDDILDDGQAWGLRVRGGVADNSIDRTRTFKQIARGSDNRNSLRDPRDWNGSVAFAQRGEDWQLVAPMHGAARATTSPAATARTATTTSTCPAAVPACPARRCPSCTTRAMKCSTRTPTTNRRC
jgi:hemoglobin/transferrin/lactoferrin receptor protein